MLRALAYSTAAALLASMPPMAMSGDSNELIAYLPRLAFCTPQCSLFELRLIPSSFLSGNPLSIAAWWGGKKAARRLENPPSCPLL